MGKEIEKKWVGIPTDELKEFCRTADFVEIKDYYFNDYTRLRNMNGKWYITIKSSGTDIRDEYEFEINKSQIDFLPSPCLVKKRFYYPYKGHSFEINLFRDISMCISPYSAINFILIECELKSPDEEVELPSFIGKNVTYDSSFYGRTLFKRLVHGHKEPIRDVVELKTV